MRILLFAFFFCTAFIHRGVGQCTDVYIITQTQMDAFNCTDVTGYLYIDGSNVTDLSNLSTLESVSGELVIAYATASSIDLSSLNSANRIQFLGLSNMTSITLSNVAISDRLDINNNNFTTRHLY